jgi:hypothetical protein
VRSTSGGALAARDAISLAKRIEFLGQDEIVQMWMEI